MAMDFSKTHSKAMVDNVMKKVDDTELDNLKRDIPIDLIDINSANEEIFGHEEIEHLAERIKANGFFGAIEVYAKKDGRYEISAGHRRYLACKLNGMKKIPCIISADVNDRDKAIHLIESNIHNRTMTPYRWAKAIKYYEDEVIAPMKKERYGTNFNARTEIAKVFNMSESMVKRYKQILRLIPELQELTKDANFPYSNIIEIGRLSEKEQREVYYDLLDISENEIKSVSKTIVDQILNKYLNKSSEDGRKDKQLGLRNSSLYPKEIQVPDTDEDDISPNTAPEQTPESMNDEDIVPLANNMVYEEPDETPVYEPVKGDLSEDRPQKKELNRDYDQIIYYIQCVDNLGTRENLTKEDKKVIRDRLQKLLEKFN